MVVDQLGQGTFGQVFLCHQTGGSSNGSSEAPTTAAGISGGEGAAAAPVAVAVKVVKNKPAYMSQAWVEVRVARLLNGRGTFWGSKCVRKSYFHVDLFSLC